MDREELISSAVTGFMVGQLAFWAGYTRVSRWTSARKRSSSSREGQADPQLSIQPTGATFPTIGELADRLFALERWVDLAFVVLTLAMVTYGAIVAPRLRYILLVALVTVATTWWAIRRVLEWRRGGPVS